MLKYIYSLDPSPLARKRTSLDGLNVFTDLAEKHKTQLNTNVLGQV